MHLDLAATGAAVFWSTWDIKGELLEIDRSCTFKSSDCLSADMGELRFLSEYLGCCSGLLSTFCPIIDTSASLTSELSNCFCVESISPLRLNFEVVDVDDEERKLRLAGLTAASTTGCSTGTSCLGSKSFYILKW